MSRLDKQTAKDEAHQINLELMEIKLKANELISHARHAKIALTQEWFILHFSGNFITESVSEYIERKLKYMSKERLVVSRTIQSHTSPLRKLESLFPNIRFSDLDNNFASKFDKKLLAYGYKRTTIATYHRSLKHFLFLATEDGIVFQNPYANYKIKNGFSTTKASPIEDVKTLFLCLKESDSLRSRLVIRRYLFACFTGLRTSDIVRINEIRSDYDKITFIPYKQRKNQHQLTRYLSEEAILLLEEELKENPKKPFNVYSRNYYNAILKKVTNKLPLKDHRLHMHKARKTFASYMVNNQVFSIKELQTYFDHSDIATTAKYLNAEEDKINGKIKGIKFID